MQCLDGGGGDMQRDAAGREQLRINVRRPHDRQNLRNEEGAIGEYFSKAGEIDLSVNHIRPTLGG
jgi:hypothetical protein